MRLAWLYLAQFFKASSTARISFSSRLWQVGTLGKHSVVVWLPHAYVAPNPKSNTPTSAERKLELKNGRVESSLFL